MLLFNKIRSLRDSSLGLISKHLMLLFNKMENNCHLFYYYISKHLMLLFNQAAGPTKLYLYEFQNISCYCLTQTYIRVVVNTLNFKTSHVIV